MTAIRIDEVHRTYRLGSRSVEALRGVTLDIPESAFVAIVGYSGCGKTTLLRLAAGLEPPDRGRVVLTDAAGSPVARPRIGFVFQEHRLLPWMTVRDNARLALRHLPDGLRDPARVDEVLANVGLAAFADAYPHQLSGGMAHRAALARALCRDPEILLMDEPFGSLDALTRFQLQRDLAGLWRSRQMTVLFVTHDVAEAVLLADLVVVMAKGRIVRTLPIPLRRPRTPDLPAFQTLAGAVRDTVFGTPESSAMEIPDARRAAE